MPFQGCLLLLLLLLSFQAAHSVSFRPNVSLEVREEHANVYFTKPHDFEAYRFAVSLVTLDLTQCEVFWRILSAEPGRPLPRRLKVIFPLPPCNGDFDVVITPSSSYTDRDGLVRHPCYTSHLPLIQRTTTCPEHVHRISFRRKAMTSCSRMEKHRLCHLDRTRPAVQRVISAVVPPEALPLHESREKFVGVIPQLGQPAPCGVRGSTLIRTETESKILKRLVTGQLVMAGLLLIVAVLLVIFAILLLQSRKRRSRRPPIVAAPLVA